KVVMSRKTRDHATIILENSMVRETAPPLQTGERNPPRNSRPIMVTSNRPSLGPGLGRTHGFPGAFAPVSGCRYRLWPQIPLFLSSSFYLLCRARRNRAGRSRFL